MYFNDIHIMLYVAFAGIGCIIGGFMAWCNLRLAEDNKIFSLEFFKESKAR